MIFKKLGTKGQLKKIVIDLLGDDKFIDAISKGTNGSYAVSTRFKMVTTKFLEYLRKNYE